MTEWRTWALIGAGAIVCLSAVFIGCDGPPGTIPNGWSLEYTLGNGFPIEAVASCGDSLYLVSGEKIYEYDGDKLSVVYEAPPGTVFNDIDFNGNSGWAAGNNANKGFLVHYDGAAWREVNLANDKIKNIRQVAGANDAGCWMRVSGDVPYYLGFWDGSTLRGFPEGGDPVNILFSPETGILYCRNGEARAQRLVMTADGGKTWITEDIPATINGFDFRFDYSSRLVAAGDGVYLLAIYYMDQEPFKNFIIKRTGAPGQGKYEISFASPNAEDFGGLYSLAFNTPGRAVAVGSYTSIVYNEPRWYKEEKTSLILGKATAKPNGGFWAIRSEPSGIYYHP